MGYGMAGHIGLGRETSWGSGVAAQTYLEAFSESMSVGINRFSYKSIIGSMGEPDDSTGIWAVSGSMRMGAHPGNLAWFLRGALHSYDVTSGTGPLYTYAFQTTSGGSDFSSEVPHTPMSIEVFRDVAKITGLVMTKLDGSARGGMLVAAAEKFHLPIHAIGVGEGMDDLRPFTAEDFGNALAGVG
jgi:hypothetical protein